ncbi:MAG: MazG-like family protein [Desulfitobacteriia bacterium]
MESLAVDVIKSSKAIEELKVELLKAQWQVQEAQLNASEEQILSGMARLVGLSYLLARRLGFDFSRLDRVLYKEMALWQREDYLNLETEWGDLSLLLGYLVPEED